jgi:hypothetical protein
MTVDHNPVRALVGRAHPLQVMLLPVLLVLSCKHTPTQPSDTTFSLTVVDVSCTEVFLQLQLGSGLISREVTLKRDTTVLFTRTVTETETTLTDSSLLPNHAYTYTASVGGNTEHCTATTMDTTSHSFSFTTTSLGDGTGSCTLYDVAIINDTLAYAVGDIYQASTEYNAAQWNGKAWQIQTILYPYQGQLFYAPLHSILVYNANDFWVGSNQPMHWNGVSWQTFNLPASIWNGWINKMWGNSSSDLYCVGSSGSIAFYNGSTWTKIESGTSLDMLDIHGAGNEILAVASDNNPLGEAIISISGNSAAQIPSNPLEQHQLYGVWFVPNRHYYVVGDGIYEKHLVPDNVWKNGPLDITHYGTTKINGNGINDVIVVGAFGEFLHFNGVSWKSYQAQTGIGGPYAGLAVHGNIVIAVGEANGLAVITIARR